MQATLTTVHFDFHPRWWSSLLAAALIAVFVSLGNWQLGKARAKEAAQAALDARRVEAPANLPAALFADAAAWHLRPVSVVGEYEAAGQILIDNRVLHERAGYHVVTPLHIAGGEARVLVNRGWIPAPAERRTPPVIDVPGGPQRIDGMAVIPSTKLFALAPDNAAAGANAVWQNLDLARYRRLARFLVQPVVIQLSPTSAGGGFDRAWPRLDERHERHLAYAFQWYGFALATAGIWLFFALSREAVH